MKKSEEDLRRTEKIRRRRIALCALHGLTPEESLARDGFDPQEIKRICDRQEIQQPTPPKKRPELEFNLKRRGERRKHCGSSYKIGLGLRGPFPARKRRTITIHNSEIDADFVVLDLKQKEQHVLIKISDPCSKKFGWIDHFEYWRLSNGLPALNKYWLEAGIVKWSNDRTPPGILAFLKASLKVIEDKQQKRLPMILLPDDNYDEDGNGVHKTLNSSYIFSQFNNLSITDHL